MQDRTDTVDCFDRCEHTVLMAVHKANARQGLIVEMERDRETDGTHLNLGCSDNAPLLCSRQLVILFVVESELAKPLPRETRIVTELQAECHRSGFMHRREAKLSTSSSRALRTALNQDGNNDQRLRAVCSSSTLPEPFYVITQSHEWQPEELPAVSLCTVGNINNRQMVQCSFSS